MFRQKVSDKYPFLNFMRVLKGIQARDLTNIGSSMRHIFNFLHLQHLVYESDRFGQGRNPCSFYPTTVMLLTDGTELTSMSGVLPSVSQSLLPSAPVPVGGDLVAQPFRWDQRVFATVLRIPSVSQTMLESSGPMPQNAPISGSHSAVAMDSTISALCESTGGKCFVATSWKVLLQHIELTASRLTPSVIVSFEHMPASGSAVPSQVHAACQRKVMYVRGGPMQGHWPIPESYWPDPAHPELPPREPHPIIAYKSVDADSFIPPNFIFDKYEIENTPFMSLAHKGSVGACWQVFIRHSKGSNHGFGDPFGFIRLNHGGSLTLFVLPYNYPVLWQLLKQVVRIPGSASAKIPPIPQWRQDMERYCNSIPAYYGPPLRAALKRWGLHAHIVPESMENSWLIGFLGTQLKRLKTQAKADLDLEMSRVLIDDHLVGSNAHPISSSLLDRALPSVSPPSIQFPESPPGFVPASSMSIPTSLVRGIGHCEQVGTRKTLDTLPFGSSSGWQPVSGVPMYSGVGNSTMTMSGNGIIKVANLSQGNNGPKKDNIFKNPFEIPREQLVRQLIQLPIHVASALEFRQNQGIEKETRRSKSALSLLATRLAAREEEEARHSLPVEKMGDFNEALLKQQPPRNPFADELDRNKQLRSMFGNPYRQEKTDGADEAWQEGTSGPLSRGRKRRRRSELIGVGLSSSVPPSEGSLEVAMGNEPALMAKILPDSPSGSEDSINISINPQAGECKEKTIEATSMDRQDSSDEFIARKDRGVEVSEIFVECPKRPTLVEDRDRDHMNLEDGPCVEHLDNGVDSNAIIDNAHETLQSDQKRIVAPTTIATKKDQHEVAGFVLTALRTLRHTRPSNTQKLFEILSIPDFPVDKCSFLEQLIEQAHRYNKAAVAKELSDYRNQLICRIAPPVGNI